MHDTRLGLDYSNFFVEIDSANSVIGNFREESEKRARYVVETTARPIIAVSGGVDSQIVMHSFYTQGLNIESAFLYMPGYNDNEYQQLKLLEKKYSINSLIVELDPYKIKDEVFQIAKDLDISYTHAIQKKFFEALPPEADIIQGIDGPNFVKKEGKFFYLESYYSFELCKIRAFNSLNRNTNILAWERNSEILLSILQDDAIKSFLYTYDYFIKNGLTYKDNQPVSLIDLWDLYIKPLIYGRYWKGELEYFPKFQGIENIDYIMTAKKNPYAEKCVLIPYKELLELLKSDNETKRFSERKQ